jgi:hypothetical protein
MLYKTQQVSQCFPVSNQLTRTGTHFATAKAVLFPELSVQEEHHQLSCVLHHLGYRANRMTPTHSRTKDLRLCKPQSSLTKSLFVFLNIGRERTHKIMPNPQIQGLHSPDTKSKTLSPLMVTVYGLIVGNRIYWPLWCNCYALVSTVTCSVRLLLNRGDTMAEHWPWFC